MTDLDREEQAKAITRGVEWAFMNTLDSMGDFPFTRNDIIEAIREGVHDAFIEIFGRRPDDPID
jgi:hypothetical protein